ncbi:MAG: histidinol-phosphate aminotransferase family protein [Cyclobacteriaceae bacterium]|nr:histidinol-phosphate aminotransferase family protein [Cyclobacteriaceae bacterium]
MKNNRREWIKSALRFSLAAPLSATVVQQLMAAPVSGAESSLPHLPAEGGKVRLNFNENPYGPGESARQAVIRTLAEGNRYPFGEIDALKAQLAKKEGVTPEHIHLGAGSGDLLCQAGVAYGLEGGSIISAFPTFPMLMDYAAVFKARWDKVNVNDQLEHDYKAMAAAVKADTKLVFICNPNNPTGTLVDHKVVEAFCDEVSPKVTVYADEAYREFLPPEQQHTLVTQVKKGANVIVSRTFSKIYGLAGLRIGYLIARPDIIRNIAQYAGDIPMSQTAIAAAAACASDESFMKMVRDKNAEARAVLTSYLDQKKMWYGKSHTNFVFFPAPKDGKAILAGMEQKGYLMRIWDFKGKEWCRVSIGTLDQMKGFVKAFDETIS